MKCSINQTSHKSMKEHRASFIGNTEHKISKTAKVLQLVIIST